MKMSDISISTENVSLPGLASLPSIIIGVGSCIRVSSGVTYEELEELKRHSNTGTNVQDKIDMVTSRMLDSVSQFVDDVSDARDKITKFILDIVKE